MTARPGTAKAGRDFDASASTVCWEDQDDEGKSDGALIGGPKSYAISILDND